MNSRFIIWLHILLFIYSLTGICSKTAAALPWGSPIFIMFYGGMLLALVVYSIGWQQIIKYLPLTFAYANRAVTVVWGLIWGVLIFDETLNAGKLVGAGLVVAGVIVFFMDSGGHRDA